jgi:uncharacterized membrane protein YhdT
MIEVCIFHLHIIGALYAFMLRWQDESLKEGFLAIGLIGLIFMIGWAITGGLARIITPAGGFATWLTADTVSLILLIIPEFIIFRMLYLQKKKQ